MAAQGTTKRKKKDKTHAPTGSPVTDPRFEAVQWDPRFQRFPKADRHVEIDKRFEGIYAYSTSIEQAVQIDIIHAIPTTFAITGMFKNPEFQQHSTVDKRGRKVEKRKNQENMRKYYKLKDEVCPNHPVEADPHFGFPRHHHDSGIV